MPPQNQNKTPLKDTLDDERIKNITQRLQPVKKERVETSSLIKNAVVKQNQIPEPQKIEEQKKESLIKPIRTYQSDVADAVRAKNESVASISLAEKKRAEDRGYVAPKRTGDGGRGIVIALLSLVLIGAGGLAVYVTFIKAKPEQVVVVPKPTSLISVSKEMVFNVDGKQGSVILSEIKNEGDLIGVNTGSLGNIKIIIENDKRVSPQDFFKLTEWKAPDTFVRSIKDFMVGVYGRELGAEIFIVLKTESFEISFPGMLAWEKNIAKDMFGLFESVPGVFVDGFIKNRDVRMIKDENGNVSVLYSFLDPNTVVITKSSEAFVAVLNQFTTNQLVR